MHPPTNNWRQRRTEHRFYVEITTRNSARNRTTQNTKKMSNTDPTKNGGLTQVLAKGKQFLLRIRHLPCYTYILNQNIDFNSSFWFLGFRSTEG